jgi:hypothetical protein
METLINAVQANDVRVLKPGDKEYEYAVATENLMFRYARPACVMQPSTTAQVKAVVAAAKESGKRLTIKNGGHSYAGFSTTDRGILLDLSKMTEVTLDMTAGAEKVTLQGGARWGHAYKKLVDGDHNGWVVNGGRCPMVGVSGFVLGGGLSPFTRSFGMGCDTLLEATIVTADGNDVTVTSDDDSDSDNGKLFWALCGAGGGNFGVVVELKMRLTKLTTDNVVAGLYVWAPKPDPDVMNAFMGTMVEFYTAKWPDATTIDSSWVCNLEDARSELRVRFPIYHNDHKVRFDATVDKHIKNAALAEQLKLRSAEEPSTKFLLETLVSQWSFENQSTLSSATGKYRIYTSVVLNNDRDTIVAVTELIRYAMGKFRDKFTGEEGLMQVTWIHTGGVANRNKTSRTTAFPWRTGAYQTYVMLEWKEKWLTRAMKGFLRTMETQLRGHSINSRAAFINFADAELQGHEEAYFGSNTEALREVKNKWDPTDFFHWNQGVGLPPQRQSQAQQDASRGGSLYASLSPANTSGGTVNIIPIISPESGRSATEAGNFINTVDEVAMAAAARNRYETGGSLSLTDFGF